MAAPLTDPAQNAALAAGDHGDAFAYLGLHRTGERRWVLRVFRPGADTATLLPGQKRRKPVMLQPV